MKLTKLFASAALSLGLAFSANAELIVQTFDLDVADGSATIEIAGNTSNATEIGGDFLFVNDELDYFNILGLTIPGMDSMDYMFSGGDLVDAFPLLEAVAYGDSVSGEGENNGFYEIVFEIDLSFISDMIFGSAEVEIFNDDFGTSVVLVDLFAEVGNELITDGDVEGDATAGAVKVSAPATLGFVLLSMGALVFARRK
jgi:hypothetical protein